MVENIFDEWNSDDEVEEDIIKNYSLLYEKWLIVIDKSKKPSQNIDSLKLEKSDLDKKISYLITDKNELNDTLSYK